MGKKSIGRQGSNPAFRESDFAGRPPQEQADLSGSLNQLSQQIAASRKLLQDVQSNQVDERLTPLGEAPTGETTGSS